MRVWEEVGGGVVVLGGWGGVGEGGHQGRQEWLRYTARRLSQFGPVHSGIGSIVVR